MDNFSVIPFFKMDYTRFVGNERKRDLLKSCLFVCLFVVLKTKNPYFTSLSGLEVKPLGVYPLVPRSSSCSAFWFVGLCLLCLFVCLFVCWN